MQYLKRKSIVITSIFIICFFSEFVQAAGIAYVQIPEQGGYYCIGKNYEQATSCAVNKCIKAGGNKSDCVVMTWCGEAQWSMELFLQIKQGPHWNEFLCGLASKAEVKSVEAAICRSRQKQFDACMLTLMIDPSGKEVNPKNH